VVIRREAEMWFRQAERDLKKACNDLVTGDWDSAVFWSQQAAEKALKAVLLNAGLVFRSHELLEIAELARREIGLMYREL